MKKTVKIIFLDIDGVLNSTNFALNRPEISFRKYKYSDDLDGTSIGFLNTLIEETEAKVVISSTWRIGKTIEELQSILEEKGFKGQIIGKTSRNGGVRGNEIRQWLQENEEITKEEESTYENYVIFDDDSDILYWQRNNFIHVDGYFGLSPNHCYRAAKILNKRHDNLDSYT